MVSANRANRDEPRQIDWETTQRRWERNSDIEFRSPRELLQDYVTGVLSAVHRPMIVACAVRPLIDPPRIWACVPEGKVPEHTKYVCSVVELNRWAYANIGTWETAELSELLKLSDALTEFLFSGLLANNADELAERGLAYASYEYVTVEQSYEDPEPEYSKQLADEEEDDETEE